MSRMIQIGPNFWNIRSSFTVFLGLMDVGTHMSLIRLPSGKFPVIDTCDINDIDKRRIDELTENGTLIEAVLATHPFHTLYFNKFHQLYPNTSYYGCPRHLKTIKIPWTDDITLDNNLNLWNNQGVQMRIPDGGDIRTPIESNHFSGIFVFHEESKSIHIDDTILYMDHPGCAFRCLIGLKHDEMGFWFLEKGLNKTSEAPLQFKTFIENILNDWEFENIIAAHTGNKLGGAKELLRQTIQRETLTLTKLSEKYK